MQCGETVWAEECKGNVEKVLLDLRIGVTTLCSAARAEENPTRTRHRACDHSPRLIVIKNIRLKRILLKYRLAVEEEEDS